MSVEVIEVTDSRSFGVGFTDGTGQRDFVVREAGESDPITAIVLAVAALAPFYWNNMARQEFRVDNQGSGIYKVAVPYKYNAASGGGDGTGTGTNSGAMPDPTQPPGAPGTGPGGSDPSTTPPGPASEDAKVGANFTMEIGGRPPKLYTSINTLSSHGLSGAAAPDFKGALNVQADGKVEGLDVPDPASTFTMSFKADYCTWKYIKRLISLVWKVNESDWYTFKADEACFMGASLKTDDQGRVDVSMRIGFDPEGVIEQNAVRVGLPNADVSKPGWHYVWTAFRTEFDSVAKRSTERPFALYVEKVLPSADFGLLGVGE